MLSNFPQKVGSTAVGAKRQQTTTDRWKSSCPATVPPTLRHVNHKKPTNDRIGFAVLVEVGTQTHTAAHSIWPQTWAQKPSYEPSERCDMTCSAQKPRTTRYVHDRKPTTIGLAVLVEVGTRVLEREAVGNKQDEVRLDLQEHADAETARAERVLRKLTLRNR